MRLPSFMVIVRSWVHRQGSLRKASLIAGSSIIRMRGISARIAGFFRFSSVKTRSFRLPVTSIAAMQNWRLNFAA